LAAALVLVGGGTPAAQRQRVGLDKPQELLRKLVAAAVEGTSHVVRYTPSYVRR
jgi:hypothetical protein